MFGAFAEHDLHAISNLPVLEVAFNQLIVDLRICYFLQSFEQDVGWDQEFLFLVEQPYSTVAVILVM